MSLYPLIPSFNPLIIFYQQAISAYSRKNVELGLQHMQAISEFLGNLGFLSNT